MPDVVSHLPAVLAFALALVVVASGQHCSELSPYASSIGRSIDATKINIFSVQVTLEEQLFDNVPMQRTISTNPNQCWTSPWTNISMRFWDEVLMPPTLTPEFVSSTAILTVQTYEEYELSISAYVESDTAFGLGKASAEFSEFFKESLLVGGARSTGQGQFACLLVDVPISQAQASTALISAVNKLCKDWYSPSCWKHWLLTLSSPVEGFGTHVAVSLIMGGGWNYKEFSTFAQLNVYGSASLTAAAGVDFCDLIYASGCTSASTSAEVDWYVSAGLREYDCFGGTETPNCMTNTTNSSDYFAEWVNSIPLAPVSLRLDAAAMSDSTLYPRFLPIWKLFNDSYSSLGALYKSATDAYVFWAGVDGLQFTCNTIVEYLVALTNTAVPQACSAYGHDDSCMQSNSSMFAQVPVNALKWAVQLNATLQDITKTLSQRAFVGYEIAVAATKVPAWTSTLQGALSNFKSQVTLLVWCGHRVNAYSCSDCCFEPSGRAAYDETDATCRYSTCALMAPPSVFPWRVTFPSVLLSSSE